MWLKIAWSLITANLGGVVQAVTDALGRHADNERAKLEAAIGADRDVTIAGMQAAAAAWRDRVDLLKSIRATQWLIVIALVPPLLHQGMIYLDSTPFPVLSVVDGWPSIHMHIVGSWRVPPAPPPYDDREWAMIGALLGVNTALGLGSAALRILGRRA